jgi:2'-5' RNA ligase
MSRRPRPRKRPARKIDKSRVTVYWLTPAEPERELFGEIIRILAKQFSAPRFEPHLTVLVTRQGRSPSKKVLQQLRASPIRLKVRDVFHSDKFAKTLFVRLKSSRALQELVVDLARTNKSRAKSVRDPHLSLLYKKIPAASRKELTATIKLPLREVVFNSIKVVRCAVPTRTRAEVEAWRVIARKRLS